MTSIGKCLEFGEHRELQRVQGVIEGENLLRGTGLVDIGEGLHVRVVGIAHVAEQLEGEIDFVERFVRVGFIRNDG